MGGGRGGRRGREIFSKFQASKHATRGKERNSQLYFLEEKERDVDFY